MHQRHTTCSRMGMSHFDLLVLLPMIAILLFLFVSIVPTRGGSRLASEKTVCLNNLRQIMLAGHNYESANMRFPSASGKPQGNTGPSFLVELLPYLDELNLKAKYDQANGLQPMAEVLSELSSMQLSLLVCPTGESELEATDGRPVFTTHYYASCGPSQDPDKIGYQYAYLNDGPIRVRIGLQGFFSPHSEDPTNTEVRAHFDHDEGIRFEEVLDGSSNTIALIESSRSEDRKNRIINLRKGWALGHTVDPQSGNIRKSIAGRSIMHPINPGATLPDWANQPISSNHSGGAQVAYADGSTHFLNEDISIEALRALSGINDGELVEPY